MYNIQSIICYNGGSGGDFLKALCCKQYNNENQLNFEFSKHGHTRFANHYFKTYCQENYHNCQQQQVPLTLDITNVYPVENTHHFHKWFKTITPDIYFIDYPDHAAEELVNIYLQKPHQGDIKKFLQHQKTSLPSWAQNKLDDKNFGQIFSILWTKQIKVWRKDNDMTALNLIDFFDIKKLQIIVERITKMPIQDFGEFSVFFEKWSCSNQVLLRSIV